MNCTELGYKVGDKFEVTSTSGHCFSDGEVVTLIDDDGSEAPKFQSHSGLTQFIGLSRVKAVETKKTLLEILVDELPKRGGWPEGADHAVQDYDSEIKFHNSPHCLKFELNRAGIWGSHSERAWKFMGRHFEADFLSSDYKTSIITHDQYESALAEKNEGWIKWDGGECPVDYGAMVIIKLRNGELWRGGKPVKARTVSWRNYNYYLDVVAYRLSKSEEVAGQEDLVETGDGEEAPYATVESLTDAIIAYGCEANLAYPLAKHLLASGLIK